MRLKGLALTAAIAGACATAKPIKQAGELPKDVYCGTVRSYWMCIAQYPDAEVSYHRALEEPASCSVLIDYNVSGISVFLKDYDCDGAVDGYLRVESESELFQVRSQDEKLFREGLDPLFRKYKTEILGVYEIGLK